MDSPRSGFLRAAATSWTLAGIGVAGVAGASVVAYGDTVKPAPVEIPAVDTAAIAPVTDLPAAPPAVDPIPAPPAADPEPAPPVQEPVVTQATQAPVPTYTPTYTPKPTVQQQAPAPAPTTKSQPAFPIRESHVPLGGGGGMSGGNSFSPHVTISRGS
ncbi:hypothetical protein ORI20_25040 [Mycobacterium sp. CVI_P3]|uniref:Alanine and proline-rich secreted protein Apa n=1 Tax=Mycobacterium pinniadriaticum TaxID=2994102 RepID=A0ABT3SM61_9MYCO|nr:hypothetical protein [Mycobacterium pinniadriaticum]MCX2933544.1 hypothetical protein [Mycobacterium pinniadriaticum]MCX2939955.1 hypothetical protein [Mycobacterium pinniadriaticum]